MDFTKRFYNLALVSGPRAPNRGATRSNGWPSDGAVNELVDANARKLLFEAQETVLGEETEDIKEFQALQLVELSVEVIV